MAITTIAALTGDVAVPAGAGTGFTTAGAFVLYGDDFVGNQECAILYRKGPSGSYLPATNEKGVITVRDKPNWVYVDKGGDFQVKKTATLEQTTVGYEEV